MDSMDSMMNKTDGMNGMKMEESGQDEADDEQE